MKQKETTVPPAPMGQVDQGVGRLAPERAVAPRRKVVEAIVGLQSWTCFLGCGHAARTGRWVDSFGHFKAAPKTIQCLECLKTPNVKLNGFDGLPAKSV
jgi:hypothetical protein